MIQWYKNKHLTNICKNLFGDFVKQAYTNEVGIGYYTTSEYLEYGLQIPFTVQVKIKFRNGQSIVMSTYTHCSVKTISKRKRTKK
jgi:hypothetical protein